MDSANKVACSRMDETTSSTVVKPSKDEMEKKYVQELISLSYDEQANKANSHVNLQTLKLRIISRCANSLGVSWRDVCNMVQNHVLVHPEVAKQLMVLSTNEEETVNLFSQDFVKTEKVNRVLKTLFRKNRQNEVDCLVAVDGLVGPISSKGPVLNFKSYTENLRFGLSEITNSFDSPEDELKKVHVEAVRRVYNQLDKKKLGVRLAPLVYQILSETIKDVTNVRLPTVENENLTPEILEECKGLYLSGVGEENLKLMVASLKLKSVKSDKTQTSDEPQKKKRKRKLVETKSEDKD